MVTLDATIVFVALPKIQEGLGFGAGDLSWVVNAYTLSFGGLLLLGAKVGDLMGRKRAFLIGAGVFALSSLVGGLAPSQAMLLAARGVQGVGGALATPSALALLMTGFPGEDERSRAIGLYAAMSVAGASIGLLAGGMLVQWATWRWVMFVNAPIAAALIPIALRVLEETPRHRGRFDLAGAFAGTLGMTALVYGFVRVGAHNWSDATALSAFASGVVLLFVFVGIESRVPSPVVPLRLFANGDRNVAYLGRTLLVGGQLGLFFFVTQFLQDVRGFSAIETGAGFLPLTLVSFVGATLTSQRLIYILGRKALTLGGMLLTALGCLWMSQLTEQSSYWSVVGPMVTVGLGNSIAFVPLTAAALRDVDPRDAGAASGLLNVAQQAGGALGIAVLVTVFGTSARHARSPAGTPAVEATAHAFTVGATHAFTMAATFAAAAFIVAFVLLRPSPPTPRPHQEPLDG